MFKGREPAPPSFYGDNPALARIEVQLGAQIEKQEYYEVSNFSGLIFVCCVHDKSLSLKESGVHLFSFIFPAFMVRLKIVPTPI